MAAESDSPGDSFEDIDWAEVDSRSALAAISGKVGYVALTIAAIAALFVYDYTIVPERDPTVPILDWHVSQVDWLFMITLAILFFYVVVPLYKNRRMTRYYWKEFRKNRAAVASLIFLIVTFLIGLIGPVFLDPPTTHLGIKYQPPMFFSVKSYYPIECAGEVANGRCYGSMAHPLGTSARGKDLVNIIVYGMQTSMKLGLIVALMVITIGTFVGTTAAYVGGMVDEVMMRYVDIQLVFPSFLLYLLLLYLFGQSLFMFVMVFGLTSWGGIARTVRGEALQRSEEEYIIAADSSGATTFYVIWRHVVPNVSNTVITAATLLIPGVLLSEAGLAFLSLGDPSIPSWGQIIAAGRSDLTFAWWISTIPGVFLFFTILAFNFLGDALRDALDPRHEVG